MKVSCNGALNGTLRLQRCEWCLKDCVSEMLIFSWLWPCDSECGGVLRTWLKSAGGRCGCFWVLFFDLAI